jgi:hypothetical protein
VSLDRIAQLRDTDRADIFREAATRLGIGSPIIIEKDFWVCWALALLFDPELITGLVFKGGTSLSKAYALIRRFSEDVDLTIPLSTLQLNEPGEATSKTVRRHFFEGAARLCAEFLHTTILPMLRHRASQVLFPDQELFVIRADDPQTIVFQYPPSLNDSEYGSSTYVRPAVRLEFGVRGGTEPTGMRQITPYCVEAIPDTYGRPSVTVRVLAAERTLWEKATICHSEYYRPAKEPAIRMSRHYSDLSAMSTTEVADRALAQPELLEAVAKNKYVNFPAKWARYDDATPAGLMIVPHDALAAVLRADYEAMAVMFFESPPSFDEVLIQLRDFEARVRKS